MLTYVPKLRKVILETISKACEGDTATLQPSHVKEILKVALVAIRQTKRVSQNSKDLSSAWQPSKWADLSNTLAASDRFKASVGLQAMCKQIVQLLQDSGTAGSKAQSGKSDKKEKKGATKRKAEETAAEDEGDAADGGKKAKHKKARKAKGSS